MPRITKGMIEAANRELDGICDLASEAHRLDNSGYTVLRYHAHSANNYLDVLRKAAKPLPARIAAKETMLKQCGWRL
jgi:hypothetical protein